MRRALALLLLTLLARPAMAQDNKDFAFDPKLGAQLPAGAVLRDEQGHPVTLGSLMGGAPLILALGYFQCPNLCGVVRDDLLSAIERAGLHAGTDYRLLVLSIDPKETPADAAAAKEGALSRYPDPGAERQWRFLTGPQPGVDAVAGAAGFRSRFDPKLKQFLHPAGIVVASPAGIVASYLLGVGYAPGDLRSAVLQADRGTVATAVSPILLLCFHFDPTTGRYSLAIFRALSLMAALTVVTLGGVLVLLRRRERGAGMIGLGLPEATVVSREVDLMFWALLALSAAVLALVFGLMLRFSIRFHHASGVDRAKPMQKTWGVETAWTVATLIGFLGLFVWGADLYVREFKAQPGAMTVDVVAKQWMWKVEHPEGQREINALHLPVNRPVQLRMTSEDVIHDFGLPEFRIKHDVLPGRYETINFTPTKVGSFLLYCNQFCGVDHASMVGQVIVMTEPDFERWLATTGSSDGLVAQGSRLFIQYGCSGCHRAGSRGGNGTVRAPPLDGVYGSPVPLSDGTTIIADDRYIHDSIVMPRSQVVASYQPLMPSFAGVIPEEDLVKLVEFIKSLGANGS